MQSLVTKKTQKQGNLNQGQRKDAQGIHREMGESDRWTWTGQTWTEHLPCVPVMNLLPGHPWLDWPTLPLAQPDNFWASLWVPIWQRASQEACVICADSSVEPRSRIQCQRSLESCSLAGVGPVHALGSTVLHSKVDKARKKDGVNTFPTTWILSWVKQHTPAWEGVLLW